MVKVVAELSFADHATTFLSEVQQLGKVQPEALFLPVSSSQLELISSQLAAAGVVGTYRVSRGPDGPVFEVGDLAARALFGDTAGQLVSSVIALALVSAVSAMVMAGPRVYSAMARDGALPRQLAAHSRRGVPTVAVVTQGVLGCLFAVLGDPDVLIRFVGFTLAIFAALTVGALFVLRARGVAAPYRTIGYPVTPVAFILLSVWIAYAQISEHPGESAAVAGVLAVGGVVYALFGRGPIDPEPEPVLPEARTVDDRASR